MNTARAFFVLVMLALASVACSPSPPTLVSYEKAPVAFVHLSDWKVTSDVIVEKGTGSRAITLEGPNDALVSIILLPSDADLTLAAFAASIAKERAVDIQKNLSIGGFSPANINPGSSHDVSGDVGGKRQNGILQRYSVKLLGQIVPIEAKYFLISDQHWSAFITTQVATEDATQAAPGFSATLRSFRLRTLK